MLVVEDRVARPVCPIDMEEKLVVEVVSNRCPVHAVGLIVDDLTSYHEIILWRSSIFKVDGSIIVRFGREDQIVDAVAKLRWEAVQKRALLLFVGRSGRFEKSHGWQLGWLLVNSKFSCIMKTWENLQASVCSQHSRLAVQC